MRLTNQVKTVEPLLAQFRYARGVNIALAKTAIYGTPFLVHFLKTAGAFPATAIEYSDRLEMYKKELPEDQAEMMMTALITLSSPFIPAFLIPIELTRTRTKIESLTNDESSRFSACSSVGQGLILGGANDTDGQDASNIEYD